MIAVLRTTLAREMTLAFRRRADLLNPLFFFVVVVSLFPIGVTLDLTKLALMAPGILWVSALLASLLSLDLMFRNDFDDGTLEQMLLAAVPPQLLVLCKIISHWLVTGLPLTLLSPLLSVMLALPAKAVPVLMLSLLLGTLSLSLIGSVGAALTVGLRKGGLLLTILIMPILVPVLIFGTSTVQAMATDQPWQGYMALLGAFAAGAFTLTPWLTVAALNVTVGD
ncbi:heme exporter protein CcmB [Reinekea sp.]|uniref:heme exporter protein CcmB n=1 Tax=Reinekea sp. TaxID=1970455 RepID=UPI002A7ECF76|nr:heme exporter protein CcmB [Reinekea sp.]